MTPELEIQWLSRQNLREQLQLPEKDSGFLLQTFSKAWIAYEEKQEGCLPPGSLLSAGGAKAPGTWGRMYEVF